MLKLKETEVTSTSTRPVENFVIITKGLQDSNNLLLDGRTVENKGKLILTNINVNISTNVVTLKHFNCC